MSDEVDQTIGRELRKIRQMVFLALLLLLFCFLSVFYDAVSRVSQRSWEQVRAAMAREDFQAAVSAARALVARAPDYEYGRRTLGDIYLAMDDVTDAVAEYSRAYQLCPCEGNRRLLSAARKRLGAPGTIKLLTK